MADFWLLNVRVPRVMEASCEATVSYSGLDSEGTRVSKGVTDTATSEIGGLSGAF